MWRVLEGPTDVMPGTVGIELPELTVAGAGVVSEACGAGGVGDSSEATVLGVAEPTAEETDTVCAVCVADGSPETNGTGRVSSGKGGEAVTSLAGSVR